MKTLTGYLYYPDSLEESEGSTYFLGRSEEENEKYLGVMGNASGFEGGAGIAADSGSTTHLFPLTAENAARLRERLPWLRPQPLGLCASAGFGDRLGLATPGHVHAMEEIARRCASSDAQPLAPIYAQQSVRENARTHRTPQQVMDDAMWGIFQTGWRQPWGADADHLKTPQDIESFYEAGYTFFTLDPGDQLDHLAQTDPGPVLRQKVDALPWDQLGGSEDEVIACYLNQTISLEGFSITFDETSLLRGLAKYGRVLAHTVRLAHALAERAGRQAYDLEISVDETELPTSVEEHFLIASELRRMGIHWVSLAPRFVGRFEKGVDYIGDLAQFEAQFAKHAAIARHFGSYRLSLHSGSDKFSIYAAAARETRGLLHLKTAGTSYLEALRVVAAANPALFRRIFSLAVERYESDRASYHVSASLTRVPNPDKVMPHDLPALLDQFDARQVFHVTFGAALDRFGPQILQVLRANENAYYSLLTPHFLKHLEPILTC